MLGPIFYFWNKTTNTLQVPYRMISPTLFEFAAITGLRPIGEIIHFELSLDYIKAYNFNDSKPSYTTFICNNMGSPSTSASNVEHVGFVSY